MASQAVGPHANPVWSTFIFVTCMLLFLFYLESMIKPMDLLESKSFVLKEYHLGGSPYGHTNRSTFVTYEETLRGQFELNVAGSTLVSIAIQKTAMTEFGKHIALDADPKRGPSCNCTESSESNGSACSCRVNGNESHWLFDKVTVGWPCGIHPGLSDLTLSCLDSVLYKREHRNIGRRYARITMLRYPLHRYVNEWREVSTHGQMVTSGVHCDPLTGSSYFGGNWSGVTLDSFLRCPDNSANNRQVRMLADISQTSCPDVIDALVRNRHYFKSGSKHVANLSRSLLQSAKDNLREMPFFGLIEYLPETDFLFKHTFGISFLKPFTYNDSSLFVRLTAEQRELIYQFNKLDTELYAFGKELFFQRLSRISEGYSKRG